MRLSFNAKDFYSGIDKAMKVSLARKIVRANGVELQQKAVANAAFAGDYTTGQTRRSIPTNSGYRDDGLTAFVNASTEYAPYVEYGTRYMPAQPFVGPAYNVQKELFKQDLERAVR